MTSGGRKAANTAIIAALAAGCTQAEAARRAGVSERTVRRRLEDITFTELVETARGELLDRTVGKVADAATRGVETLEGLLDADSERVRLGAARALVELAMSAARYVRDAARPVTDMQASNLTAEEAAVVWQALTALRTDRPVPSFTLTSDVEHHSR